MLSVTPSRVNAGQAIVEETGSSGPCPKPHQGQRSLDRSVGVPPGRGRYSDPAQVQVASSTRGNSNRSVPRAVALGGVRGSAPTFLSPSTMALRLLSRMCGEEVGM